MKSDEHYFVSKDDALMCWECSNYICDTPYDNGQLKDCGGGPNDRCFYGDEVFNLTFKRGCTKIPPDVDDYCQFDENGDVSFS